MKKATKITLWVLGSLVVLVIVLFMSADIIASRVVRKEVAKSLGNIPDTEASVGNIYLNLISGSAIVKDIHFETPGITLHVPTLSVWNIRYWELFREHRLVILAISVDDGVLEVQMDEKHPEALLPMLPKDTALDKANQWLQSVEVGSLRLSDFCAHLESTRTSLSVVADSLSVETNDIAYRLTDSVFSYNDSVYELALRTLRVKTPAADFAVEAHDLQTRDQGALRLGYTRLRNLMSPKQMADKAKEPTTWIDLELNSLSTSALNPIRKALAEDYTLDSIAVDVKRMHVCRDERHKPKTPFAIPQEFLRQVPVRFRIKHVSALARRVDVEMATTDINCGKINVRDIRAALTNVTNQAGATWYNSVKAPFGKSGKVEASYKMLFDTKASFEVTLDARDVETQELDGFIRPLIGITSVSHIDHLYTQYKGDKNSAQGKFCMEYHGMKVQVHKEDAVPYEVITKNADTFTTLANSLVTHSNPSALDPAPRSYAIEWKRDPWKPYPLYLFGPCIDGVVKTLLPGLYVHKQVKEKK